MNHYDLVRERTALALDVRMYAEELASILNSDDSECVMADERDSFRRAIEQVEALAALLARPVPPS